MKCFRAVVPAWGNFSDKNTHSSRLLHQILICEYRLHSGLHFWPNRSAFVKNDNGPFSLVKCSAYILNSLLIIATKCRGFCKWQAIFQISAFMLCFTMSLWHCRRGIFPTSVMTREMISPNHMLGVISSPKSSLPHLVFLHTHLYHRGKFFIYLFPSKAEGNSHQSTCFLKYSVSHQSPWMEPCPPAVSPVRQRYCKSRWPLSCGRQQVIWHLSHSHLLQDPWAADF